MRAFREEPALGGGALHLQGGQSTQRDQGRGKSRFNMYTYVSNNSVPGTAVQDTLQRKVNLTKINPG